jgi:hypothetical protein
MSSNPLSSSSESGTNRAKFCDKAHASAAGRTKVFLACQPNDLRAGFDGLTAKVQQTISARSGFGDRGSACASVSFASGSATTIGAQGLQTVFLVALEDLVAGHARNAERATDLLGRTVGIIGYGRIGREVAERAAGIKCRVVATNRTSVADPAPADTVFPLAELDRMLPLCDTVLISCGLGPETRRSMDARRLALMKPGALLINVARAAIVDEDALYAALKDGHLGGAALDVWWQYPTQAEPERRPSRRPFHELPNVLVTPHNSSSTEATADRRWSVVAANLDRFARGEKLENVVLR